MKWVLENLQEIKQDNFLKAREVLRKERENVTNFETNLDKYNEKLRQVEAKLMKGYE